MPSFSTIDEQRKSLPIYGTQRELLKEIRNKNNIILIGETGCGKTTQVPQFIHKAGMHKGYMIACTQPRRVAAVTVATRVAQEMQTDLGKLVGYCVRFDDTTSESTKVKYMTDGMLLRESILDPLLMKYSFVILDEAHERTLHTDVLFGITKQAQAKRALKGKIPLKIIIMSATMDADHFSRYFGAEVLYLEGRSYPVQCMYTETPHSDYVYAALVTTMQIHRNSSLGEDILIFLTGEEEIESVVRTLREVSDVYEGPKLIVSPLYAKLSGESQLKAFHNTPKHSRKCIVATNIAETSLTIPGIKHVIDSGMVKTKTFDSASGLDILTVGRISKSQAWQRLGRAGRISAGICYRLYTEQEFNTFQDNTTPEVLRSNLANVLLQLYAMGVSSIQNFDFMDKPDNEALETSIQQLLALDALVRTCKDSEPVITSTGKKMAAFPVDPRLSKSLLVAHRNGCLEEILTVTAMLSVEVIFTTSRSKEQDCLEAHRKFKHVEGDHLTLLNVYRSYKSSGGSKEWCSRNYLNQRNLKQASDVRAQLKELCEHNGLTPQTSAGRDTKVVRQSLLAGYFQSIAELQPNNQYNLIMGGRVVSIHPSSVLFQCKPQYILYNELVKTSKCYMRNVSIVEEDALIEFLPERITRKLRRGRSVAYWLLLTPLAVGRHRQVFSSEKVYQDGFIAAIICILLGACISLSLVIAQFLTDNPLTDQNNSREGVTPFFTEVFLILMMLPGFITIIYAFIKKANIRVVQHGNQHFGGMVEHLSLYIFGAGSIFLDLFTLVALFDCIVKDINPSSVQDHMDHSTDIIFHALKPLFTIAQMVFIKKFRFCCFDNRPLLQVSLVSIIASNAAVWLYTVVDEDAPELFSKVYVNFTVPVEEQGCSKFSHTKAMLEEVAPYFTPFTLEFSLFIFQHISSIWHDMRELADEWQLDQLSDNEFPDECDDAFLISFRQTIHYEHSSHKQQIQQVQCQCFQLQEVTQTLLEKQVLPPSLMNDLQVYQKLLEKTESVADTFSRLIELQCNSLRHAANYINANAMLRKSEDALAHIRYQLRNQNDLYTRLNNLITTKMNRYKRRRQDLHALLSREAEEMREEKCYLASCLEQRQKVVATVVPLMHSTFGRSCGISLSIGLLSSLFVLTLGFVVSIISTDKEVLLAYAISTTVFHTLKLFYVYLGFCSLSSYSSNFRNFRFTDIMYVISCVGKVLFCSFSLFAGCSVSAQSERYDWECKVCNHTYAELTSTTYKFGQIEAGYDFLPAFTITISLINCFTSLLTVSLLMHASQLLPRANSSGNFYIREALHFIGITNFFEWVNDSFITSTAARKFFSTEHFFYGSNFDVILRLTFPLIVFFRFTTSLRCYSLYERYTKITFKTKRN